MDVSTTQLPRWVVYLILLIAAVMFWGVGQLQWRKVQAAEEAATPPPSEGSPSTER
ncbi:MAG: hypothetical protein AAF533_24915 [Acidobacteriota bacterium]